MKKNNINIETIGKTSDEDLYGFIWEKGRESGKKLNFSNEFLDAFFAVHMLEAEVINGGFDQFFYNGGYEIYSKLALIGLQNIGASKFEQLMEEAIEIHEDTQENFRNERNLKYDSLNVKFHVYNENEDKKITKLNKLQIAFIRSNPELFF